MPDYKNKEEQLKRIIEDVNEFIANGGNALDYWTVHVAPDVTGHNLAKRISLIWAASLDKIGNTRGRIHILFFGAPGSGKTQIMEFWAKELQCETASPRSTKASLTVYLGKIPQPGLLARASIKGWLLIDELHVFPAEQQQSMLQAMETGEFDYNGGGHSGRLRADCRILALCNRIANFSPEFLDRFDIKIYFKKYSNDDKKEIVKNMIQKGDEINPHDSGLGMYISSLKKYYPTMSPDIKKRAVEIINWVMENSNDDIGMREVISFYRAIYAVARLNMRDVTENDIEYAIGCLLEARRTRDYMQ